jgi:hypothetical protein
MLAPGNPDEHALTWARVHECSLTAGGWPGAGWSWVVTTVRGLTHSLHHGRCPHQPADHRTRPATRSSQSLEGKRLFHHGARRQPLVWLARALRALLAGMVREAAPSGR